LFPIQLVEGKLNGNDLIYNGDNEVGKVLIDNNYPFALFKNLNENLILEQKLTCKNSVLRVLKPKWIK